MLPRKARIRKGREIKAVIRSNKRSNSLFDIYIRINDAGHLRFGVITTKILGKANKRNRVKRRIVEAINKAKKEGLGKKDVIIIPKKKILEVSFENIIEEITKEVEREC